MSECGLLNVKNASMVVEHLLMCYYHKKDSSEQESGCPINWEDLAKGLMEKCGPESTLNLLTMAAVYLEPGTFSKR